MNNIWLIFLHKLRGVQVSNYYTTLSKFTKGQSINKCITQQVTHWNNILCRALPFVRTSNDYKLFRFKENYCLPYIYITLVLLICTTIIVLSFIYYFNCVIWIKERIDRIWILKKETKPEFLTNIIKQDFGFKRFENKDQYKLIKY